MKPIEPDHEETWARRLELTGRFKILRKLAPRPIVPRSASAYPRVGIVVDSETTGLDPEKAEIIELGMVAFTYADDGRIGDVIGVFDELREPDGPIPPEITRLTGIGDAMVAGKTIDPWAVDAFIADADLIIAHHAAFDRPFCEKLAASFASRPWACSVNEIAWAEHGFEGSKLGYLIGQSGFFHEAHRAADDCHALLQILDRPWADGTGSPFAELLRNSNKANIRIFATYAPFDLKDVLKGRGYRWNDGSDGRPKAWWIDVCEDKSNDELSFLRSDIYQQQDADPPTKRLTAFDRFKREC